MAYRFTDDPKKQWINNKIDWLDRFFELLKETNNGLVRIQEAVSFAKRLDEFLDELRLPGKKLNEFAESIRSNSFSNSIRIALGEEPKKEEQVIIRDFDKKENIVEESVSYIKGKAIEKVEAESKKRRKKDERITLRLKENTLYVCKHQDVFVIIESERAKILLKKLRHSYIPVSILTKACGYKNDEVTKSIIGKINSGIFNKLNIFGNLIMSDKNWKGYKLRPNHRIVFK